MLFLEEGAQVKYVRLEIPGGENYPRLRFIANPLYSLYHQLAAQSQLIVQADPRLSEAVQFMKRARFPLGLHGHWDDWEIPITMATSPEQAANGIIESMTKTAEQIRKY